jgi:hypothetical protein
VPADVEPPALARLLTFAERPRAGDWSLRSALVRYAQGKPQRVSDLLDVVRRVEGALHANGRAIRANGIAIWAAVAQEAESSDEDARFLVGLIRAIVPIDTLADDLADWAVDRFGPPPDGHVDEVTADVARRLDQLGVQREERAGRPPRGRR